MDRRKQIGIAFLAAGILSFLLFEMTIVDGQPNTARSSAESMSPIETFAALFFVSWIIVSALVKVYMIDGKQNFLLNASSLILWLLYVRAFQLAYPGNLGAADPNFGFAQALFSLIVGVGWILVDLCDCAYICFRKFIEKVNESNRSPISPSQSQ